MGCVVWWVAWYFPHNPTWCPLHLISYSSGMIFRSAKYYSLLPECAFSSPRGFLLSPLRFQTRIQGCFEGWRGTPQLLKPWAIEAPQSPRRNSGSLLSARRGSAQKLLGARRPKNCIFFWLNVYIRPLIAWRRSRAPGQPRMCICPQGLINVNWHLITLISTPFTGFPPTN